MFFSQKTKGFFVELNEHSVLLARTSASAAPFTVEDLRESPTGDGAALEQAINQVQPKKSPSGYLHGTVGVYPASSRINTPSPSSMRVTVRITM